jgi:hypothetical protein
MALSNYTALTAGVYAFLSRSDQTANVDTYIGLAEAWLNRKLRVRQMETTTTTMTVTSDVISHPTDWLQWKDLRVTSDPIQHLDIYSEETADQGFEASGTTGYPKRAIVRGNTTIIRPVPDGTYTYQGVYYAQIPALTSTATTNWLLTSYPDAYLYGALLAANLNIQDDSETGQWGPLFNIVVKEIEEAEQKASFGGGSVGPRVRRVV